MRNNISELKGQTLRSIERVGNEELHFTTSRGYVYRMYHSQDCCESVQIESITGDLTDLLKSPLLEAEEVVSAGSESESCTWTFYKLGTIKGHVTIRWLGESNGYYSETVDFELTHTPNEAEHVDSILKNYERED